MLALSFIKNSLIYSIVPAHSPLPLPHPPKKTLRETWDAKKYIDTNVTPRWSKL